jgi:Flp pilus assembly protein TadD
MRTLLFAVSLAAFSVAGASPHRTQQPPLAHAGDPQVDTLFGQLARVSSDEEAKPIEEQILTLFLQSGSASVDLLMARTAASLAAGDLDTSRSLLQVVTEIAPEYAEGWHQRGKLQAAGGDDEGAIISLQKAVTLNPRQFEAMTDLADMLEQYGDKPGALKLYRRALALDPQLAAASRREKALSKEVEGQGI